MQIFENRGAMMGASNPHPHCQIWASHAFPNEPREGAGVAAGMAGAHGSCLLCDYAALELRRGERMVDENDAFADGGAVLGGVAVRDDGDRASAI